MLSEKEFKVIEVLGTKPDSSQRDLASAAGFSLGMTNLLLKRLANKGFVKIRQLDWNRVQYILTPKGMVEKVRKAAWYTSNTLRQLKVMTGRIQGVLFQEYHAGRRDFYIVANEEAKELILMALGDITLPGIRLFWCNDVSEVVPEADTVFLAAPSSWNLEGRRVLSLLEWSGVGDREAGLAKPAAPALKDEVGV